MRQRVGRERTCEVCRSVRWNRRRPEDTSHRAFAAQPDERAVAVGRGAVCRGRGIVFAARRDVLECFRGRIDRFRARANFVRYAFPCLEPNKAGDVAILPGQDRWRLVYFARL